MQTSPNKRHHYYYARFFSQSFLSRKGFNCKLLIFFNFSLPYFFKAPNSQTAERHWSCLDQLFQPKLLTATETQIHNTSNLCFFLRLWILRQHTQGETADFPNFSFDHGFKMPTPIISKVINLCEMVWCFWEARTMMEKKRKKLVCLLGRKGGKSTCLSLHGDLQLKMTYLSTTGFFSDWMWPSTCSWRTKCSADITWCALIAFFQYDVAEE